MKEWLRSEVCDVCVADDMGGSILPAKDTLEKSPR